MSGFVSASVFAIVPTYNRREKTLRFIEQFQQQTYPQSHLVIVDANSPDGTAQLIRERFPQVTVLDVPDQYFWTAATNAGVAHALRQGADFIFTVNDDAILSPNHVADLVGLASKHHVKILGNRINYLDPPEQVWALGTYTEWGTANFLRPAYTDTAETDVPISVLMAELLPVDALPGNGVLIHRSVFEQIGIYQDWWLPHYHGDSELIMRAKQAGINAFVAPGIMLHNDFHLSQKKVGSAQQGGMAKLKATFFSKRSHLFAPAVLYILFRYCPPFALPATCWALLQRLRHSEYVKN
jgi:GT2 family glycosyltransferase